MKTSNIGTQVQNGLFITIGSGRDTANGHQLNNYKFGLLKSSTKYYKNHNKTLKDDK